MAQQKQSGFTLIELMIVVIVLGILAAIALPSFQSTLERRRLVGATDILYANLQYARTEAIKQNQAVQFSINTGTWCYGIDDNGANCDCTAPASCTVSAVQKVVNGSDYPSVTIATDFATSFTFDSRQGRPSDNGTFTLTINGQSKSVSVNPVGRIKVD